MTGKLKRKVTGKSKFRLTDSGNLFIVFFVADDNVEGKEAKCNDEVKRTTGSCKENQSMYCLPK